MFKQLFISALIFVSSTSFYSQTYQRTLTVKDTITDKELVIPENIERNFDQLLVDWKKDMKMSDNCYAESNSPVTYPDSVYINRLYSLPTVMELAYNPIVRSYIDMYTGRMRSSVQVFLGKSKYYFPIFEEALDRYGLPLELKYLPIIESALNPTIGSRMGATGLWQFMLGTGKMYDLEINSLVDERRDPFKSTDAAARYLRDLYNIYGDWNLVIAAYNCGPGNVNKAIKRNGGVSDYWSIYPYLPKETRGYVPAFIAATYAMNYADEHNICSSEYKYISSIDTVVVNKHLHLQQISEVLDIPLEDIRSFNPQFKEDVVPGQFKSYTIHLPSSVASEFYVNKEAVYAHKSDQFLSHRKVVEVKGSTGASSSGTRIIRHKVRKGESLSSIASRNGVTIKQIRGWNKLKSNRVKTGQVLAIHKAVPKPKTPTSTPTKSPSQTDYLATTTSSSAGETKSETIEGSNTLSDYFKKQADVNEDQANLSVPTQDDHEDADAREITRTPNEPQTIYHKVRMGETVALIASRYNVDKDDISKWNKLKSAIPKIGQRLVIHLPAESEKTETEIIDEIDSNLDSNTDPRLLAQQSNNTQIVSETQYREYGPSPDAVTIIDSTFAEEEKTEIVVAKKNNVKESAAKAKAQPKTTPAKAKTTIYTVKKGDTLGHIAARMGNKVTAQSIKKANGLSSNKLKIGQKLKIPR